MGSLFKFNSPMIMTPKLLISLLLLRTPNMPISLFLLRFITMKMLLHHIYSLHPKLYNRCHRLKMVRLKLYLQRVILMFLYHKKCVIKYGI
jgi:hypothetical protein